MKKIKSKMDGKNTNLLLLLKNDVNKKLLKKFISNKKIVFKEQLDFEKNRYDLIILDYYYLKKYYKNIKRIKENEMPNFLPIIFIGNNRDAKKIFYKNTDILDELIIKPVDKIVLKNRIKNLLKTRKLSLLYEKNHLHLAENSPIGIIIVNNNIIKYANPSFARICGLDKKEIISKNLFDFITKRDRKIFKKRINKDIIKSDEETLEIELINSKGNRWVEVNISKFMFKGNNSKLITFSDITKKRKANSKIKYLSFHDKLTGLYNRAFFEEEKKRLNTKRKLPLSIIMGDMNSLKMVNDAFGHAKGDNLLKKLGNILKESTRKEDIVARIGGDEFGILLPKTLTSEANKISKRIIKYCNKINDENQMGPIKLSMALGIATKNKIDEDINEIFAEAEDNMYRNKISESHSIRHSILSSLEKTLQEKTNETKEHAKRMEKLALKLGNNLNLSSGVLDELKLLAKLHDIGKVAVPEKILKKPDDLTYEEYEIVKNHPESGYRIVKSIPTLAHVAQGVLSHHERWDGNGYPQGLSGKEIPYISRIISIVDAYDVIIHERSYKESQSKKSALKEIKSQSGKQFDPYLVKEFIELI